MDEASSSREKKPHVWQSSDERKDEPLTSGDVRRGSYYGSQVRASQPSNPSGNEGAPPESSRPRRKARSLYLEPSDFANLNEQTIPPPIQDPGNEYDSRRWSTPRDPGPSGSGVEPKFESYRKARNKPKYSDEDDTDYYRRRSMPAAVGQLSEMRAPPPVEDEVSELPAHDHSRPKYLEDTHRHERGSDGSAAPRASGSKSTGDYLSQVTEPEVPKWLTQLYTISYLVFFSLWGTLARLGLQWLTFYPGAPVTTPVIWANFGGSLIMGFLSEDQGLFRNGTLGAGRSSAGAGGKESDEFHAMNKAAATKHKKAIPLYIGLTTGFCGSFTSFSSFARDFFLALSNNLPAPINHPYPIAASPSTTATLHRSGGYSFLALLAVVLQTVALSLGGLIAGAQIAVFLDPVTPALPTNLIKKVLDRLMVLLAFGCWLGAVFLSIWPPDRPHGPPSRGIWRNEVWRGEALFALVFAPLGCLLRFYASLKLNGIVLAFPLGTFAVNMLGTAIEGMCYDIQHVGVGLMGRAGGGRVGCQVLQGVMDGFCGCLTTVSTWVAEVNGLKPKHGWLYALASLAGGLCLMVVVMGSVRWSTGFTQPLCNTGYTSKI